MALIAVFIIFMRYELAVGNANEQFDRTLSALTMAVAATFKAVKRATVYRQPRPSYCERPWAATSTTTARVLEATS